MHVVASFDEVSQRRFVIRKMRRRAHDEQNFQTHEMFAERARGADEDAVAGRPLTHGASASAPMM
jgi:hypothetical protein